MHNPQLVIPYIRISMARRRRLREDCLGNIVHHSAALDPNPKVMQINELPGAKVSESPWFIHPVNEARRTFGGGRKVEWVLRERGL